MANQPTTGLQTHATFNYADSDVILRSSDGVLFRVHKTKLAAHSTVFQDMFECGTAGADERIVGIPVSESAATLEVLLSLCYPAANDDAPAKFEVLPLGLLAGIYEATCKYGLWVAGRLLRRILLPQIRTDPFVLARAGFVARDRELAQLAAEATLKYDILDGINGYRAKAGAAWSPLVEYHMRCRREMQSFVTGKISFNRSWNLCLYALTCHTGDAGGCGRSADSRERRHHREQAWDRFCLNVANGGAAQLPKAVVLLEMATHRENSEVRACEICRDHWDGLKALVEKFTFTSVFEL